MPAETSPLLQDQVPTQTYGPDDGITSNDAEGPTKPAQTNLFAVLTPLMLAVFFVAMDGTIVISSYTSIGNELKQLQNTSWIATSYMLTMTSFQPLYGKLSDIFGRKNCLIFAYTVFAFGCLFCGMANSMNQLIAARAFAGIGGGGISTMSSIIMSDVIPLRSRGTYQGIMNIIFASGSATGAPLGGLLADSIGWRWSFMSQFPAVLLAVLIVSFSLDLPKSEESHIWAKFKRIDFLGAFTLILATFLLLFGLDRGGNISWKDTLTISSLVASAVFTTIFVLVELKWASEPFAPARIIFNRTLIASYLVNFFGFACSMTSYFHVTLYFQAVLGKTATQAGLLLLPSIAAATIGSLCGGVSMQVTGKYYILNICAYSAIFAGGILLVLMTGFFVHSLIGIIVGITLLTGGNGTGVTSSLIALMANAGPEDQAIATALSYLFRSLGSVVGISVGSSITQETLRTYLHEALSRPDVEEVIRKVRESLEYLSKLDPATKAIVITGYEKAIGSSMWFTATMAGLGLFAAFFIVEKPLAKH